LNIGLAASDSAFSPYSKVHRFSLATSSIS
jgi:hypothetical protein